MVTRSSNQRAFIMIKQLTQYPSLPGAMSASNSLRGHGCINGQSLLERQERGKEQLQELALFFFFTFIVSSNIYRKRYCRAMIMLGCVIFEKLLLSRNLTAFNPFNNFIIFKLSFSFFSSKSSMLLMPFNVSCVYR